MKVRAYAIVHFRTPDILENHLESVKQHAPHLPIFVIDTDDPASPSAHDLKALVTRYAGTELHHVPNHSYAASVNHALDLAGLDDDADGLVIIANADAFPGADTVPALEAAFQDPDVGLAGPLGRTPSGRLQDMGLPYRLHTSRVVGQGSFAACDVPWLSGFFLAVRLSAARSVGGMDTTFRFYNEDIEWSFRFRKYGWRCRLVGAEAEHMGGSATPNVGRFLVEGLRGGMVFVQRYRSPVRVALQRAAIMAWAELQARVAPTAEQAQWHAVARMFRRGRFNESPFGETLADDASGFPEDWPTA